MVLEVRGKREMRNAGQVEITCLGQQGKQLGPPKTLGPGLPTFPRGPELLSLQAQLLRRAAGDRRGPRCCLPCVRQGCRLSSRADTGMLTAVK